MIHLLLSMLLAGHLQQADSWQIIETPQYKVELSDKGTITQYIRKNKPVNDTVSFRSDVWAGFAFEGVKLQPSATGENTFTSTVDGIDYSISYKDDHGMLMVETAVKNTTGKMFIPHRGVKVITGVNTCMTKYPQWNNIYFPTMLRCERTHMNSYFASPNGKILTITSPDPIASWSNEYQYSGFMNVRKRKIREGMHRINTSSFYLLHCLPLPLRHPQNLFALAPGKEKRARFFIQMADNKQQIQKIFASTTHAPVLSADLYTLPVGETFRGEIMSSGLQSLVIRTPRHEVDTLHLTSVADQIYQWNYTPFSGTGEYTVTAVSHEGKISEMKLYVRPDFDFYLAHARKEGLRSKPTHHHAAENFMPFFSYFLSRRYIPSAAEDQRAEIVYDSIFTKLYDPVKGEMRRGKWRIQDFAYMAGALTDRYQITHDIADLEHAASLVEYLIKYQKEEGSYCRPDTRTHYTSVTYIAKSVMEVMNEEKKLAQTSKKWAKTYQRHKASLIRAIDDLSRRGDNVDTEGQLTFEDGMISCSATQLALAALKTNNAKKAKEYMDQAINLNRKHWCLTQSMIPDSRMNGATLRFWEYQYTINYMTNALNSPCGWSAWKFYGSWYLYLLTGNYGYLREVINGLGSCMQLLDAKSGELRFSFVSDPYVEGYQFTETPIGSEWPDLHKVIVGEQYMSQSSNWHHDKYNAWRTNIYGVDNFVHETFKCMCEVFMENAYIIEKEPGVFQSINCTLTTNPTTNALIVTPSSSHIQNLHVNLQGTYNIEFRNKLIGKAAGLQWIVGYPDDLRKF